MKNLEWLWWEWVFGVVVVRIPLLVLRIGDQMIYCFPKDLRDRISQLVEEDGPDHPQRRSRRNRGL